ncbi:Imm21 family immunity protein [Streptomyces sp. NK15101]|uniref:Imm21 family immunity protein n=1 Tax=Streptomyces sp. NK15101 TaxID=2873261 RepID=UPI001CEC6066|nr:Imm21 family immunity protein [Streptomyces sp. NK15101]
MDLAWIESEGGPVIVLEEALRHLWGGYTNSDYDNACEVDGYAGLVPFEEPAAPGPALAINDIPAPTTYMEEFGAIVQWIAAPSDSRIVEVVRAGIDVVDAWEDGPIVRVNGRLSLFDAALPGTEAGADELLLMEIEPGAYRLKTADIESASGTCARVHKLDRLIE